MEQICITWISMSWSLSEFWIRLYFPNKKLKFEKKILKFFFRWAFLLLAHGKISRWKKIFYFHLFFHLPRLGPSSSQFIKECNTFIGVPPVNIHQETVHHFYFPTGEVEFEMIPFESIFHPSLLPLSPDVHFRFLLFSMNEKANISCWTFFLFPRKTWRILQTSSFIICAFLFTHTLPQGIYLLVFLRKFNSTSPRE